MMLSFREPWTAFVMLFFTTVLRCSCSAGISFLLCFTFWTLPFPPLLSTSKGIAHCLFVRNKVGSLVSSKKCEEVELLNPDET